MYELFSDEFFLSQLRYLAGVRCFISEDLWKNT